MDKPFSQACENNKGPILEQLSLAFANCRNVLEIGSGTGQHAVYFAPRLTHLQWQTSDQPQYHPGITRWINDYPSDNLRLPLSLTLGRDRLPDGFDGIYTANTAHIMQREEVQCLMEEVSRVLPAGGIFCQYGPFLQNGTFSSQSNEAFHHKLISQGYGGYRDISELERYAPALTLEKVVPMPANNLMLKWNRKM